MAYSGHPVAFSYRAYSGHPVAFSYLYSLKNNSFRIKNSEKQDFVPILGVNPTKIKYNPLRSPHSSLFFFFVMPTRNWLSPLLDLGLQQQIKFWFGSIFGLGTYNLGLYGY